MLNKEEIRKGIEENSLVENYCHLDTQLQPNGIDLTVDKIFKLNEAGKVDFSNSEREIPSGEQIEPVKENEDDKYGWWGLEKGVYKVKTNEKVNLPNNMVGLLFTRSSLLRVGCYTHHALVDSGFKGVFEFVLVVGNEQGVHIKENGRICQIVFKEVGETEEYSGIHASE